MNGTLQPLALVRQWILSAKRLGNFPRQSFTEE